MRWLALCLTLLTGCSWIAERLGIRPATAQLTLVHRLAGRCDWVRREVPSGQETLLASLPAPCDAAEAAFSPDLARGVIALGALEPGSSPPAIGEDALDSDAYRWTLYDVSFPTRSARPLGVPGPGRLDDFGIDRQGVVRAATVEPVKPDAKSVSFGAETYPVPDYADGAAALLHGFSSGAAGWTMGASRVVALDPDGDPDGGFDWESRVGPRTLDAEEQPEDDDPSWVNSPALTRALDQAVGRTDAIAGTWRKLSTDPPLYNFVALDRGQTRTLVLDDGRAARVEGDLKQPSQVARVEAWHGFALVVVAGRASVRDPDGKLVYSGADPLAAFWP